MKRPIRAGAEDCFGSAEQVFGDHVVQRRGHDEDVERRQADSQLVHEAAHLDVGGPIAAQRGGCREHHDDRGLDHESQWEDHAAPGGQVDGRVGQPGYYRRDGGSFEPHEDPTGGERPPSAQYLAGAKNGFGHVKESYSRSMGLVSTARPSIRLPGGRYTSVRGAARGEEGDSGWSHVNCGRASTQ